MDIGATGVAVGTRPGAAGLLAALAAQDFPALRRTLAADVRLRALLPDGPSEWNGADEVAGRFEAWFGDTEEFDPAEVGCGDAGGRVRLRWRLRLRAERLGPGWFAVEQVGFGDTDADGRLTQLDLVCTGYLSEDTDA